MQTARIHIISRDNRAAGNLPFAARRLRVILEELLDYLVQRELPLPGIYIYLIDDRRMCQLNKRHLGRTGPTNVLSFPAVAQLTPTLFLSLDTWRRECVLYGQNPQTHLFFLLAHGFLHLAGLDHGPRMSALEEDCRNFIHNLLEMDSGGD